MLSREQRWDERGDGDKYNLLDVEHVGEARCVYQGVEQTVQGDLYRRGTGADGRYLAIHNNSTGAHGTSWTVVAL